ncbi:hypothetical protein BDF20DRAFT_817294 [Mycotypha africana]|uniref:uncharacterized protein n=1 Tax=Mycotypha africana TaxID=64632 RepID=UPI0023013DEF|nr:uncharacterized protein BDF20DRAFT_817294 [Mycotypha africana]KAI8982447.1 hypothetical protein BDF20DRAFT_817294 [Mycotypha africana]
MGQTPSTTASSSSSSSARLDNASTRTLHSTSIDSHRPVSFFKRISNRLHVTHPARRFGRSRSNNATTLTTATQNTGTDNRINSRQRQQQDRRSSSSNTSRHHYRNTLHTSSASITSSVRRATQEAARSAAAATGPPAFTSFLIQPQHTNNNNSSSRNSLISTSTYENNNFLKNEIITNDNSNHLNTTGASTTTSHGGVQSSASSTSTSRRMHILVIEYRPNSTNTATTQQMTPLEPLTAPPTYRFLGLRRPRSEVSTTSSTETIQSMPLSMNSTQTNNRSILSASAEGQWIVYVLNPNNNSMPSVGHNNNNNNNNATLNSHLQALSSSLILDDNPSYEDLLWLTNILGPARPNTTTQQAVDEAIPVISWSNDTKKELKDYQCLVCLDEFATKQPVRVLKCHHVFHRECVDRWLCEAHNSCPVCRGVPV